MIRSLVMSVTAACLACSAGCQLQPGTSDLSQQQVQLRDAVALAQQAQAAESAGRIDEAIDLYSRSAVAYRGFPASWNNLGALLMEKGLHMEAIEAFRTAAEISPTDPRPHTNIGLLWQKLGYLNDAADAYSEALRRDANYLPALRESVLIDTRRDQVSAESAERVRRALLLETDPAWKADLARRKTLIEQRLASQKDSPAR
ncbi:MAG: tetratricopeptide repeat protein [Phycisphaerales bacterium]